MINQQQAVLFSTAADRDRCMCFLECLAHFALRNN